MAARRADLIAVQESAEAVSDIEAGLNFRNIAYLVSTDGRAIAAAEGAGENAAAEFVRMWSEPAE